MRKTDTQLSGGLYCHNTAIPPAYIIEEEVRKERDLQRPQFEQESLPLSLPEYDEEPFIKPFQNDKQEERVIVIEL